MNALVTGTFEAENQAIEAVRKLLRACVPSNRVRTILPGTRKKLVAHRADSDLQAEQHGGILVAVKAPDNVSECLALRVLRQHGARNIERRSAERRSPRSSHRKTLPSVQYPLPL
jgi:hypothetical protein